MKKSLFFLIILLLLSKPLFAFGSEHDELSLFYEEAELYEADEIANDNGIDFSEILTNIYDSDGKDGFLWLFDAIKGYLSDISISFSAMKHVFVLACLGAMLTVISETLGSSQAGSCGFYVCYICLIGILTAAFTEALKIVEGLIELLLSFMRAILPAYYMSIYLSIGSADGFYGIVITTLTLLERLVISFLLPGVKLYMVLMLLNYLQTEDNLSKMAELIKTLLDWVYKSLFAAVLGLQLIQGLIAPYKAAITKNVIIKAAGAIPGIGNSISSVSSVIIGSGMLIKNTIGIGGIIVITFMCLVPVVKLMISAILYQTCAAIIQPFADKRMVQAVDSAASAIKLLLKFLFLSVLILIVTLALLCTLKPV